MDKSSPGLSATVRGRGSKTGLAENHCVAVRVLTRGRVPWGSTAGTDLGVPPSRSLPVPSRSREQRRLAAPSPEPLLRVSLTFSSPVATLKTSSTTQPTARRAAPDECTSFHMVSLSTCGDSAPR